MPPRLPRPILPAASLQHERQQREQELVRTAPGCMQPSHLPPWLLLEPEHNPTSRTRTAAPSRPRIHPTTRRPTLAPAAFFPSQTPSWFLTIPQMLGPLPLHFSVEQRQFYPSCTGSDPLGGKPRRLLTESWRKDRNPRSLVVGQRQAGFGRRMVAMRDMECGPPQNPNRCSQSIGSTFSVFVNTVILQLHGTVRKNSAIAPPKTEIFLFLGVLPEIFFYIQYCYFAGT